MAVNDGSGTDELPDQGFSLYIVSIVMVIVAGLFIIARLAARLTKNELGWDDYTIFAALVASIGLSLTENMAVTHGYGRHAKSLTHTEITLALKWFYIAQILYKVIVALYRISFLCLYLRIFIDKTFRLLCKIGITFTALCNIAFILVTIFQCLPVTAIWDKTVKHATCIDSKAFWFSYAMINIVSDVTILALPIPQILKLHLSWRTKLELIAVFMMGSFVCATTIIRTTTLARSAKAGDPTWTPVPATVWSVVEANTGIICACLPMIKGLVFAIFPAMRSSGQRSERDAKSLMEKAKPHRPPTIASNIDRTFQPGTMRTATYHPQVSVGNARPLRGESEDSILERGNNNGKITKMIELSVSHHNDRSESLERL